MPRRPTAVAAASPEEVAAASPEELPGRSVERFNLNLPAKTARTLRRLSEVHKTSMTETIRRAVAVLDVLDRELVDGAELQVITPEGLVKQLVIV